MIQVIRHCSDCGGDRLVEQYHAAVGSCPDAPDGDCPEWFCTECGAALLIGFAVRLPELGEARELRDRVA